MGQPNLNLLPRQGTRYKQDPIVQPGHTLAVMGEAGDGHRHAVAGGEAFQAR